MWICTDCELGLLAHFASRDTCNHFGSDKRHFTMKEGLLPHLETNHAVLTSMRACIHTQTVYLGPGGGISSSFIYPFQSPHTSSGNGRSQRDYGVVGSLLILGARIDRQSRKLGRFCFLPLLSRPSEFPSSKFQESSPIIFAAFKYVTAQSSP